MKILITGTTGFIGRTLFEHLKSQGHEVYGTVRKEPREGEIRCNVTEDDFAEHLPNTTFDAIIHTVGSVDQTLPKKTMFHINAGGTQNIASWAKAHGCKHFIQISSTSAYGVICMGEYRTESTPRCRNIGIPYMTSKAKAERIVEKAAIPYTILRLPGVLGAEDSYLSPSIVPRLLSGNFFFCGKKDRLVSTLYIKNFNLIIDRLLEAGPLNDAYNCTDFTTTWRTLIKEYSNVLNVDPGNRRKNFWLSLPAMFADKLFALTITFSKSGAHYPNDKLQARLGKIPQVHAWEDGVKEAVEGFINDNQEELAKYDNIRQLKTGS